MSWMAGLTTRLLMVFAVVWAGGVAWSAETPEVVRLAVGSARPMTYLDSAGRARGFAVEVLEEAARREGVMIEWVESGTKPADAALRDGTLDMLPAGIVTPQRLKEFVVTNPWWESATEALVLRDGPIRSVGDLRGRPVAANRAGEAIAGSLMPSAIVPGGSVTEMAELVCAGRADAAVVTGMFVRQLLADKPALCRGVGLSLFDLGRPVEYALVARTSKAALAWRLRARLDEITLDGTLSRIAGAHPDISAPLARRATELLRARYDERLARQRLLALGALMAMLVGFLVWTLRSRARLKAAMSALKTGEERWRALVEMGSDWIWEVNLKGQYTFSSPMVKELLGYEPEEVIGRLPTDFMPPAEAPRLQAMLREVTASPRREMHLESVRIRKDGSRMVMETNAMPIHDAAGVLAGFRGTSRDVTMRKRREKEVAAQAGVNRALAEGADLSGKLNGALNAMQGVLEFEFAAVWRLDEWRNGASCVATWSMPGPAGGPLGEAARRAGAARDPLLWQVIGGRESMCEPVAGLDAGGELAAAARAAGLGVAIGLPMRAGNALNGAFLLFTREAEAPEPQTLVTLLAIAGQVGEAMEREKAEEQVRRFVSDSPTVLYALRVLPDRLTPTFVSSNVEQLTGFAPAEAMAPGWWLKGIHPDDLDGVLARNPIPYDIDRQSLEYRFRKKDGSYIWVLDEKRLLRDGRGGADEVVGAMSDVTKRVELEQQLRHAQKMEAIGSLAAGVAHDFNNLLTVINGFSELLLREPAGGAAEARVHQILQAGEKAAALTRQLLAMSRKEKVERRVFQVGQSVGAMEEMLRRLIGEDIELVISNPAQGRVMANPGQFEQVVLNLVVNARDAMPAGGRLEVQTADLKLTAPRRELAVGDYVELKVSDTGSGMDAEVANRIFEPFFTTKEPGQGTGLGLATVYGILKQMGGSVEVESEPGRGSTFTVMVPCGSGKEVSATAPDNGAGDRLPEATILLVEDEPAVKQVTGELLRACGYAVVEAESAEQALDWASTARGDDWRLLLTDVVMPKMNGIDLAERIMRLRPHLKVLLMSGYPERGGGARALPAGVGFVQKPFKPGELVRKIRLILDEAPGAADLLS